MFQNSYAICFNCNNFYKESKGMHQLIHLVSTLFINKKCLYLCSIMFIWWTWLNYKSYEDFWKSHESFYGAIKKRNVFFGHLVDYLYSLVLKFIVLGVSCICKGNNHAKKKSSCL
jgi:hypothetical protein